VEASIVAWLDGVSGFTFRTAAALFVVVNVVAVGAFLTLRNRSLVQRWTSPWLAANLLLLGAGAGVPALSYFARITVQALAPTANVAVGVIK
jgi:hypothetical protein